MRLNCLINTLAVIHAILLVILVILITKDNGWIQNEFCDGGLKTYECKNQERRSYENACEGVMTTTMGLFIVSIIAIFGAEMMIVVLCAKMLSVVPKWYGFLLFTHSSFGDLILMCAWIYLSSNKDQCWEDMKKGARVGKNVNLVICVSIVCSGVSAAFFYLGMKIWKGQGHLFARRSIDTVREHLLVSAYDDDDPSSSYEPPSSGITRIAVALHNCDGDNEDELSFRKGDTLELHEREGDWWVASLNGKRGLVPHNYIDELSEEL